MKQRVSGEQISIAASRDEADCFDFRGNQGLKTTTLGNNFEWATGERTAGETFDRESVEAIQKDPFRGDKRQ